MCLSFIMTLKDLIFPRRRFLRFTFTLSSFLCFSAGFSLGAWLTLYHQFQSQVSNHQYELISDNEHDIIGNLQRTDENYLLLSLLILTSPRNFKDRETLRATWLKLSPSVSSPASSPTRHFFVIGTDGLSESLRLKLEAEQEMNEDLILMADLKDSFDNLTLKVAKGLKYLIAAHPSHYILKCDDDSFVRIDEIVNELEERQRQLVSRNEHGGCYQWGFFDGRAPVLKRGKWKESDYNLCDLYLPYALGGGYVISRDCVDFINKNFNHLKKFKNEDVAVGTWLSVVGPERKHDVRFDTQYASRGCNNKYLVQHKLTLPQMAERYNNLVLKGLLCKKEIKKRPSWEYNWNVHPSHCCKLNESII